jgi:gamma-glutamylcyclotransferase
MYYFAYASNLSKNLMKKRCPDSKPLFTAVLPNYKLVFTGWSREWRGGKASIKSFRGEKIRGAVYEISDACLRQLDKYEPGYQRMNITVYDEDNEPYEAITYIKSGQLEESRPSEKYGEVIRQGYRDWGLV